MKTRVALATFVALLAACGSGSAADFEVPLTSPGGDAYRLLIYDGSGLVTGGRSGQHAPGMPTDQIVAIPDRFELEIRWTGGACHHKPTMRISGDATHLQVDVRNPDDPDWLPFLPIECPAVGIPLRVTLSLAEPIEADAVELEVHYE